MIHYKKRCYSNFKRLFKFLDFFYYFYISIKIQFYHFFLTRSSQSTIARNNIITTSKYSASSRHLFLNFYIFYH